MMKNAMFYRITCPKTQAILNDLEAQAALIGPRALASIFFGGGTPSDPHTSRARLLRKPNHSRLVNRGRTVNSEARKQFGGRSNRSNPLRKRKAT